MLIERFLCQHDAAENTFMDATILFRCTSRSRLGHEQGHTGQANTGVLLDCAPRNGKFTTTMVLKLNPDTGWMAIQAMTSLGEDMMRHYRTSIDAALPEGEGAGAGGTAYRSGKSSLRNNRVSNVRMTPWRE